MDMSHVDADEHGIATPPSGQLLSEQRRGLAIILAGVLIVLLAGLPWRFFVRPALAVSRLPQNQLDFRIDLNQATWAELIQLPGIGPSLAERILSEREAQGPFRDPADLGRVRGIGPQILERVLPFVETSSPPPG